MQSLIAGRNISEGRSGNTSFQSGVGLSSGQLVETQPESYTDKCVQYTANPYNLKYKLVDQGHPFSIVIRGLHESFDQLGIPHEVVRNVDLDDQESAYILLTTHEDRPLPTRYISYNFEQLGVDRDPQWNSGSSIDFVVLMKSGIIRRPMLSTYARKTFMQ